MFCNRVSPNLYESHSLTPCHSNSWWITGLPKLLFFAQVTVWADRPSLIFAIAVNSLFYWKFMLLTAMGKHLVSCMIHCMYVPHLDCFQGLLCR